jgi:hypothetical protein
VDWFNQNHNAKLFFIFFKRKKGNLKKKLIHSLLCPNCLKNSVPDPYVIVLASWIRNLFVRIRILPSTQQGIEEVTDEKSGSGSVSQRYVSEDPDPHPDPYQNVTDPDHCSKKITKITETLF